MTKEDYFKYYIQGSDHYLIPRDIFEELFNEMTNWKEESNQLQKKYNTSLSMLVNHYPPCEIDGFMDKNTDYCSINCGVDEEIFKKCWDRYITQTLMEKTKE